MRETGVVRKVVDGRAFVLVRRESPSCCSGCTLCTIKDAHTAEIELAAVPGLQPRDEVIIEIPRASPLRASILLFLVPMLLLVGAAVGAQLVLFSREAWDRVNLLAVAVGLVAMIAWYGLVSYLDRRARGRADLRPKIVEFRRPAAPSAEPGSDQV